MASSQYELSYVGVVFGLDGARTFRMGGVPGKHQPLTDLVDEVDKRLPFRYLQDFTTTPSFPGRALGGVAFCATVGPDPNPDELRVGDYYYPTGAVRWSVFRGLVPGSIAKTMLANTNGGRTPATFVMKAMGSGISTSLYMLPPRPLSDHGGGMDGLYLITLVDERYHWRFQPCSLSVDSDTTWSTLIASLASTLGITISAGTISDVYGRPNADSPLWSCGESAAVLLDAIAFNLGRVVVRSLSGTYQLQTLDTASDQVRTNLSALLRGKPRTAGGDLFFSGNALTIGKTTAAQNAVLPATVEVHFPKYVVGPDPVPHYLNPRVGRGATSFYEDSHGSTYAISVPIASGSDDVSGLVGVGTHSLHTTARALVSGESSAAPGNLSGLTALAMKLAQDRWSTQTAPALDVVYPGIVAWTPEGIHDLVWTYSARAVGAQTRVLRTEWNNYPTDFQHEVSLPVNPPGEGGKAVAQSWRDSFSGSVSTTLTATLASGGYSAALADISHLPTQNRWRGLVGTERILFEGTSGGLTVGIARRGIDGTRQAEQANGSTVTLSTPDQGHGINLVTSEKMQFVYPSDYTSGGMRGVNVVPQTQTVRALAGSGVTIKGKVYYSGEVALCDPITSGTFFPSREPVWLADRNDRALVSGRRYDGQFAGFSASGPVSPVYVVADQPTTLASGDVKSGHIASGAITNVLLESISYTTQTVNLTTNLNVLNVTSPIVLLNPTNANLFIYGINVPVNIGFYFEIINIGSEVVTIPDESASSSGAQIQGPSGDLYLYPGYSYSFKYVNGFYYPIGGYRRLGPAEVASGMVASGGVNSGNIASGTIYTESLSSGTVSSGHVASGAVINDNIASGQVQFFTIGSGAVGSGAIASGQVSFFHITNNAIQSGSIASGQVGVNHFASGSVRSGTISSGQIGVNHLASGAVRSGAIASGQVSFFHLTNNAIQSGSIASGQVGVNHLASGAVQSGSISSGQIGLNHVASGAIRSGAIASGQVGVNHLASGAIRSGAIASGQVGVNHLASGSVLSGHIASGQVGGFHVASGSIRSGHLASGFLANFTGAAELLGATNVTTDESTTSTSYTDLATADSVTFTLGTASAVLVVYLAMTYNSASVNSNFNIVNIDGADESSTAAESYDTSPGASYGMSTLLAYKTGSLSAASHTIKIRHKTDGGTANWRRRMLMIFKAP